MGHISRIDVLLVLVVMLGFLALPACRQKETTKPESAGNEGAGPTAAQKSLDDNGQMQISETDRCPVCGMVVAKHEKFAAAIELDDATTYYFCATGCMIRSWLHPEVFLGVERAKLKRAVVHEYFTGAHIDAHSAQWVAGSDIVGPMGPALVPLKDEASLKTFKERHGGKETFTLKEVDDSRWEALTGKKAVK